MPVFSGDVIEQLAKDWTLTYKVKLGLSPTIVVAGAYQGKLMNLLYREFPSAHAIVGFEPARWAFSEAVRAVDHIRCAHLYNEGLLAEKGDAWLDMGEWFTDACSILAQDEDSREHDKAHFIDAALILKPFLPIDLFVMNVEGYEYKLLPYLLDQSLISRIDGFAVQFHTKYRTEDEGETLARMEKKYRRIVDDYPRWVYWSK